MGSSSAEASDADALMCEEVGSCSEDMLDLGARHAPLRQSWWRLAVRGTLAATTFAAALALAVHVLHPRQQDPTTWSQRHDTISDFSFHFSRNFKRFEDEMKGVTGTCLSGTQCKGNLAAVTQSCNASMTCVQFPTSYCCMDSSSKITTSVSNGEVTCTCSTTSKMLQKIEAKIEAVRKAPQAIINKIKAMTGQCLIGRDACAHASQTAEKDGKLYCCPHEFNNIVTSGSGTTARCVCS